MKVYLDLVLNQTLLSVYLTIIIIIIIIIKVKIKVPYLLNKLLLALLSLFCNSGVALIDLELKKLQFTFEKLKSILCKILELNTRKNNQIKI